MSNTTDPAQQSKPINDTLWHRFLTLLAVKFVTTKGFKRFFKHPGGVLFISDFCIKSGLFTTLAEANAMRFVAQHTSIPVPTVHCSFMYKGETYIVMSRIQGQKVAKMWGPRSPDSKARILKQVKQMIEELHNIPPPKDIGVSNVDGGAIYDCRLPDTSLWGPFNTIRDFHRRLRNGFEAGLLNAPDGIEELIAFHDQQWPTPVFTHADLSSLNILVCGDEVVGIVDWETAGWFPPYWEYTTAWHVNPRNEFWQQEVDKFLPPMPYALKMESIRRRYFGAF